MLDGAALAVRARMPHHGPTWHNINVALLAAMLLAGCYRAHGRESPAAVEPDPVVPVTPAPDPDAGPPPLLDAGLPEDPCAVLFEQLRTSEPGELACDLRTFRSECSLPINPCCEVVPYCVAYAHDGGHVAVAVNCDDWCAQGCGTYSPDGCTLAGCEWFAPDACGPAPPGAVEGPRCIEPRGAACSVDAECPDGHRCLTYWVNPCATGDCDACGGEERRCAAG